MKQYLRCLRAHRGVNDDECRMLSKSYLVCRMERNLMAPDEMKNLGYAEEQKAGGVVGGEGAMVKKGEVGGGGGKTEDAAAKR